MKTPHRASTTLHPSTITASRLRQWFTQGRELFRAMMNRRESRRALMMLNDHQLADIGLVRADIDAVAAGRRSANVLPRAATVADCLQLPMAVCAARSTGKTTLPPGRHTPGSRAA